MQSYKVFFNDSSFLLTDNVSELKNHPDTFLYTTLEGTQNYVSGLLKRDNIFHAKIYHSDIASLFQAFASLFSVVEAAGGTIREKDRILLIQRWGIPDLPKGHKEAGESIEECALREVEEECGIGDLQITGPLPDTWHIYFRDKKWYLKHTFWFRMRCRYVSCFIPQTEEGIENVFWLPLRKLPEILDKTYPSLRTVLEALSR